MTRHITYVELDLAELHFNPGNARVHSKSQVANLSRAILEFGFTNPVLVDERNMLIAGHGRAMAAKSIGMTVIPAIRIKGLSAVKKKQLAISDNALGSQSKWDREALARELNELIVLKADLELTHLEPAEIDSVLIDFSDVESDPADAPAPRPQDKGVASVRGDVWQAGSHRIMCGDARILDDLQVLCRDIRPAMMFTDPPYNLKISTLVGRGKTKYREFPMGSGEMSPDEFYEFLTVCCQAAADCSRDGAIHYLCMDWRHIDTVLGMGRDVYQELLNIAVWVKSNGGQGSFYRSQHEMIAIFLAREGTKVNNIQLGRHNRNRTNVWNYPSPSSFGKNRSDAHIQHPTLKPVEMIADAIRDCTKRGDAVLDPFCGAGSTLMGCEKIGRVGCMLELDPAYVDQTVARWQRYTGRDAIHFETGERFDDRVAAARKRSLGEEN